MSGSVNGAGAAGAVTAAGGVAVLPFTSGSTTVSFIVLTAIACALVVIVSKVIKKIIIRNNQSW